MTWIRRYHETFEYFPSIPMVGMHTCRNLISDMVVVVKVWGGGGKTHQDQNAIRKPHHEKKNTRPYLS